MPADFKFTMKIDADKLAQAFRIAPRDTVQTFNKALLRIGMKMEREAKVEVPVDTGRLRASINTSQQGGLAVRVGTNVKYAIWVHGGTGPHFVPAEKLQPWSKRKGVDAYAVAKSISRKGTKANPFMQRAFDASQIFAENESAKAMQTVVDLIQRNAK